jgi:hypothetical protein
MCSPKTPAAAPVVTPPPPAALPKPLGVDDQGTPDGVSQLRSGSRNGLAIRAVRAASPLTIAQPDPATPVTPPKP